MTGLPLVLLLMTLGILALAAAAAVILLWRERNRAGDPSAGIDVLRSDFAARTQALENRQSDLQSHLTQQLAETQRLLQESLSGQTNTLQGQTGILQKHMTTTQETLSQVRERMGAVHQATERMGELGREMEELQRLLRAPKARGELGEVGLRNLLSDILPTDRVTYQHGFSDGSKVDALIHLDRGNVPVDAKFPVEDFLRLVTSEPEERRRARKALLDNVKKKITEISRKYIRTSEGTLSLALMYLPSEAIYYEAFVVREKDEPDLWNYAYEHSVLPLSPGTMSAYLKSVALGLRAAAVEANAREVLGLLQALEKDVQEHRGRFDTLGTHLSNAQKKYDESDRALHAFATRLEQAKHLGEGREDPE